MQYGPNAEALINRDEESFDVGVGERLGITRPRDRGVLREFRKGAVTGGRNLTESVLSTAEELGSEGAGDSLRRMETEDRYRRELEPAPGGLNKAANIIGQGVEQLPNYGLMAAGAVLSGGLGAAPAIGRTVGLGVGVFSRVYGPRKKELRAKGLTETESTIGALISSGLEVGLESAIGGEAIVGKHVDGLVSRTLKGAAGKEFGEGALKAVARGFKVPSTYLGRAALIEAEEVIEENLALFGNALVDEMLAGDGQVTLADIGETTYQTLLQTLPFAGGGALLSGGRQDVRRKAIRESVAMPPNEETLRLAYSKNGTPSDMTMMNLHMQAVNDTLGQRFTAEEAADATTLIRTVSENLAAMDETRLPEEFVEGIRLSFERGEIDQTAWNEANEIADPAQRHAAKVNVLKSAPTFGQEYYDITERALAVQTRAENDSREQELFRGRTEQDAATVLNDSVTPPEDGVGIFAAPAYAVLDEQQFDEVYRRGFVRGVSVDGESYTVYARGQVANPEGGRFLVRPGDLVFIKSNEIFDYGEAQRMQTEKVDPVYEDKRSQWLDQAVNLDSEWAYRSRKESVRESVEAEAEARGELLETLQARLAERESAQVVRDELAEAAERRKIEGEEQRVRYKSRAAKARILRRLNQQRAADARARVEGLEDSPAKAAALKSFDEIETGTFPVTTPDMSVEHEEAARLVKEERTLRQAQGEERIRKFRERQAKAIETAKSQAVEAAAPEQQQEVIKSFDDLAAVMQEEQQVEEAPEPTTPIQQELFRREDLAAEGIDPTGWFSEETTPRAFYDRSTKALHFFNSATADDIIHEWFHHLTETTGLMPARLRDVLVDHYTDADGKWQPEAAVQGLLSYIRDKQLPEGASKELSAAFAHMHKVLAGSAQAAAGIVNDETLAAFDAMFGFKLPSEFVEDGEAIQRRAEHAIAEGPEVEGLLSELPPRLDLGVRREETIRPYEAGLIQRPSLQSEISERISNFEEGEYSPEQAEEVALRDFVQWFEDEESNAREDYRQRGDDKGWRELRADYREAKSLVEGTTMLFSEEPLQKAPEDLTDEDLRSLRGRSGVGAFARALHLTSEEAKARVRQIASDMFGVQPDDEGSVLRQLSGAQLQDLVRELRRVGESERTRRYNELAEDKFGKPSYEELDNRERETVRNLDKANVVASKHADKRSETAKLNKKILEQLSTDLAGRTESELRVRPKKGPGEAPGSGKPGAVGQSANYLKVLWHELRQFRSGLFNRIMLHTHGLQDLLNILGENNPKSVFMEMRGVVENMNARHAGTEKRSIAKIEGFYKARGLKHFPQTLGRPIEIAGREITQEEAVAVAMATRGNIAKDERGEYTSRQTEALFESNGEELVGGDRDAFDAMIKDAWSKVQADKELAAVMGTMDDYFMWIKGEIDAERERMGLGPIGDVLGYFPLIREGGMFVDVDAIAESMGITPAKLELHKAKDPRFKRRSSTYGGRIRLDAINVFNSYRKQADIYIAKEGSVLALRRSLALSSEMFTRRGLDQERAMLDDLLEAERHTNGRYTPMDPFEIAIRAFGSKYKLSIFALNMPSAFKQVFSAANGAALLPAMDSWRVAANMTSMFNYALRHGGTSWPNVLQGHPTWEMMVKGNSVHTQSRYIATEIGLEGAPRGILGMQVRGVPVRDLMLLPQRHMDMLARTAVWGATYDSQMRQMRHDSSKTESQKHEAAFREAERVTRETQPAATMSDRASMQKTNEWLRAITPFTGQLFKNWNLAHTRMYTPMKQAWAAGQAKGGPLMALNEVMEVVRGSKYAKQQYNMTSGTGQIFAMAYVAPALALSTLARGRPPKDWDEFMGDMFAYNISMIPVLGPLISSKLLYDKWQNDGSPMYYEFLNGAADVIKAASKGDLDTLTEEGIRTAARTTGFPSKVVRFLEKVGDGQFEKGQEPDWTAITGWALFGEKMD